VTAALAWYDEPPKLLDKSVRAIATVADKVVALDGAYERVPDGKPSSPKAQARVIARAAEDVGLDCIILTPHRLWKGQVEKRSRLLQMACEGDWFCWFDADHIVHGDRDQIRAELEETTADVLTVPYHYPKHPRRNLEESSGTDWHYRLAGTTVETPHFFRCLTGIRLERLHYWLSAMKDGRRHWLWSDSSDTYPYVPHKKSKSDYYVNHECLLRDSKRIMRNRAFCNDRVAIVAETGQEDHLESLAPPKYDYTLLL